MPNQVKSFREPPMYEEELRSGGVEEELRS
jgi:hypothetical protein